MNNFKAYLFGSVARGDQDPMSDTDVLLVYDKVLDSRSQADARAQVSSAMSMQCTFAEYSYGHLERMFKEGHLFAWHLHLEARPIPGWESRQGDARERQPTRRRADGEHSRPDYVAGGRGRPIWPIARFIKHDLGSESETWRRHVGLPAETLPFLPFFFVPAPLLPALAL